MSNKKQMLIYNASRYLHDELLKKGRVNSEQFKVIESVLPVVISNYNKHHDELNNCESSMNNSNQFVDIKVTVGKYKSNKHPHHDLIVEWAKDTSKIIQVKKGINEWSDCNPMSVNWLFNCEYRFKPREFVKGHWYPCLDDKSISVCMWNGLLFVGENTDEIGLDADYFDDIGKSLGEIEFG